MRHSIRIGTRGSKLALIQTNAVISALQIANPELDFQIINILSTGDEFPEEKITSFGIGAFTSKLEQALIEDRNDIAVHSLKDLPTSETAGTTTIPVLKREDPRDVVINRWSKSFLDLPKGARIGTSSIRRIAQLQHGSKDILFLDIRGNVETRINKSYGESYDGVILAAAGIKRLGLEKHITEYLSPKICTPSAGQATIAAQVRENDSDLINFIYKIVDQSTILAVQAERELLKLAGGGCNVPMGVYAFVNENTIELFATITEPDGSMSYRVEITGESEEPKLLAHAAYQTLIEQGAASLLEKLH